MSEKVLTSFSSYVCFFFFFKLMLYYHSLSLKGTSLPYKALTKWEYISESSLTSVTVN